MESVSETYWALADKADKKFTRLRDLPPYGGTKWDAYFHKAFQVYTKLWKYQQENRQKLVDAGLKRWEIGEIASRIGQLYYNYYLRTSDATFLSESFIFYEAIMSREYFKDTSKDPTLANKHLRYYTRFIVVCLLLNRREMVHHLVRQLRLLVDEYRRTFQGNDAREWKRVVQEVVRFLKADAPCINTRPLRYSVRLDSHPNSFPLVARLAGAKPRRLKDAVLVSYYLNEVKFTELTLDTFRFLQCLEWEPSGSFYRPRDTNNNGGTAHPSTGRVGAIDDIIDQTLPPNPHKYILYRPSISQLLLVMATACEELPPDCILLLYFSASGKVPPNLPSPSRSIAASTASSGSDAPSQFVPEFSETSYVEYGSGVQHGRRGQDTGADLHEASPSSSPVGSPKLHTHQLGDLHTGCRISNESGLWLGSKGSAGLSYIYPSDILPFTRRPLFIVVDSDYSLAFEAIHGAERGEAAVLLLSPLLQPGEVGSSVDSSHQSSGGSFFTFFLTAPLLAFCRLVNFPIADPVQAAYDHAEKILASLFSDWGLALSVSTTLHPAWARILCDPFLRQLVLRFILCRACLGLHVQYGNRYHYLPRCLPSLPDEVLPSARSMEAGLFRLASSLHVIEHFRFSSNNVDIDSEVIGKILEHQKYSNRDELTAMQDNSSVESQVSHEEQPNIGNGRL